MLREDLSLVVVSNDLDVDEASQVELLRAKQRHDELLGNKIVLDLKNWCCRDFELFQYGA